MRFVLGITQAEDAGTSSRHIRGVPANAVAHGVALILEGIGQLILLGDVLDVFDCIFWPFVTSGHEPVSVLVHHGKVFAALRLGHRQVAVLAFIDVLWLGQLNPLEPIAIVLVDRHALCGLERRLSHGLLALLVVLVGAAHCLLHADLAQLLRTDAAFCKVLLENVHDVVKAKLIGVEQIVQRGLGISLVHPRLMHAFVDIRHCLDVFDRAQLKLVVNSVFPSLGQRPLGQLLPTQHLTATLGLLFLNPQRFWIKVQDAFLGQLPHGIVWVPHLLADVVAQVALDPVVDGVGLLGSFDLVFHLTNWKVQARDAERAGIFNQFLLFPEFIGVHAASNLQRVDHLLHRALEEVPRALTTDG